MQNLNKVLYTLLLCTTSILTSCFELDKAELAKRGYTKEEIKNKFSYLYKNVVKHNDPQAKAFSINARQL